MSIGARDMALRALTTFRLREMRSDEALNSALVSEALSGRDASLAARIYYGVIQNRIFLDHCISKYSSVKLQKLQPQVLDILRLSVYQLLFLTKVPANAAVNEGVALAKKNSNPRAAGLVNAVLRRVSENRDALLLPLSGELSADKLETRYSHPSWLISAFIDRLGIHETELLLQAHNEDTPITIRVNTLRTTVDQALSSLHSGGAETSAHWLEGSFDVKNAHKFSRLEAFQNGLIYVQDPAAALAAFAADPQSGMFLVDGCASPGGKSLTSAILMGDKGHIISCDISDQKLQRIDENASRLGLFSIETCLQDAQTPYSGLYNKADIVFADVPCSGFGVIRKKPEIRYKTVSEIESLPELQLRIVQGLSRCVKPGGVLLYSTCTLLKCENEDVVEAFLKNNLDFSLEAFSLPGTIGNVTSGMVTLWPHRHQTDGFFIAKLRRQA